MLHFNTQHIPLSQQQDYWQDAISQAFVPLNCHILSDQNFQGALQLQQWQSLSIARVESSAQTVERKIIRSDQDSPILMSLIEIGTMGLCQNGREAILQSGQFAFYDSVKPYDLHFEDQSRQLVFMFPRQMFSERCINIDKLTALGFGHNHPLTQLHHNFASSLFNLPHDLSSDLQSSVLNQYLDLVVSILSYSNEPSHSQNTPMFAAIQRYILNHYQDSQFSIHQIAAAFRMSPRYVSKIFQKNNTTVGKFLLDTRLNHAKKLILITPLHQHKIGEIAFMSGFNDVSYFSREFKKKFKLSPSEYKSSLLNNL